jgi:hypothetical protein
MNRTFVGNRALLYLAQNCGFKNRIAYGDLMRALRLPEGTPLQQRISEKRAQGFDIRSHEEPRPDDGVLIAFYFMTAREAKRVLNLRRNGFLPTSDRREQQEAKAA